MSSSMVALSENAGISATIRGIENLSRQDPGSRGLASKAPPGLLEPAARALLNARRILLVTGFCVRSAMTGETDGPPGTSSLAAALTGLGSRTMILTDKYSAHLVVAACAARNPKVPDAKGADHEVLPWPAIPIAILPDDDPGAIQACRRLAAEFAPDLILAVERPGSAADGHRYSMRGMVLDDIAPSAESLFTLPGARSWITIAIGDGGNELGMGSLRASCFPAVDMGEKIFCTAAADYPVVAGISNWGAYALAGAVSILAGKAVLPSPEEEFSALLAVYEAGGVDGSTREHSCTVDGLSADDYLQTLRQINNLVLDSI